MTRSSRAGRPRAARPPSGRDPYGLLPVGTPIAAIVSVIGLVLVAAVSLTLLSGRLPSFGGAAPATTAAAEVRPPRTTRR